LHNHPGMTVLSRVLYGSVEVKTFDIIGKAAAEDREIQKERSSSNRIAGWLPRLLSTVRRQGPSSSSHSSSSTLPLNALRTYENDVKVLVSPAITELYPQKDNVHQFTAGEDGAAVLDVLVPPYDTVDDRDCTFYEKDFERSEWCEEEGRTRCWLIPIEQPEWFRCLAGSYNHLGVDVEVQADVEDEEEDKVEDEDELLE